jgi:transposase-like protein
VITDMARKAAEEKARRKEEEIAEAAFATAHGVCPRCAADLRVDCEHCVGVLTWSTKCRRCDKTWVYCPTFDRVQGI